MNPPAPRRSCSAGAAPTMTESPTAVTGTATGGGRGTVGAGAADGPGARLAETTRTVGWAVVAGAPVDVGAGGGAEVVVSSPTAGSPCAASTFSPRLRLAAMGSGAGRRVSVSTRAATPRATAETRTHAIVRRRTGSRRGAELRKGRSIRPHETPPATRAKAMVTGTATRAG